MTVRNLFTADEWQLLIDVPALVGTGMMIAGKSGLGTVKESFAIAQGMLAGDKDYPSSELIAAIMEARRQKHEKSGVETLGGPYFKLNQDELRQTMLAKVDECRALLAGKVSATELDAYRRWCLGIGERVAKAAKEGDFLGFGGVRVSSEESSLLALIAEKFGTTPTATSG